MIPDRSSPSRVRFAASRPGRLAGRSEEMAVHEGKGGVRAVWTGRKEPFGHTGRLEPQPRGAGPSMPASWAIAGGHGLSVATTTTASLGLRACSGPIARPTGCAHLPAGCAAPGRILPCPRFSGVGLPILGASSGEQLAFDGLRLRRARKGARRRWLAITGARARIRARPCRNLT